MTRKKKSVVTELRNQAEVGRLQDDVAIVYRLKGGSGDQNIDESVIVSASGELLVRVRDELKRKPEGEARVEIGRDEALDLCRLLLQGIESMIPASKARFIPDTLVGLVSLVIGDQKETFYFEADEEDCEHRGQPIAPEIRKILERYQGIETRCLSEAHGPGHRRRRKEVK